jgi:hypothetical protein
VVARGTSEKRAVLSAQGKALARFCIRQSGICWFWQGRRRQVSRGEHPISMVVPDWNGAVPGRVRGGPRMGAESRRCGPIHRLYGGALARESVFYCGLRSKGEAISRAYARRDRVFCLLHRVDHCGASRGIWFGATGGPARHAMRDDDGGVYLRDDRRRPMSTWRSKACLGMAKAGAWRFRISSPPLIRQSGHRRYLKTGFAPSAFLYFTSRPGTHSPFFRYCAIEAMVPSPLSS